MRNRDLGTVQRTRNKASENEQKQEGQQKGFEQRVHAGRKATNARRAAGKKQADREATISASKNG